MGGGKERSGLFNENWPAIDHPDALRVIVEWKTNASEPRSMQYHGVAHKDWPTACDHMRRLLSTPGACEVMVRRGQ